MSRKPDYRVAALNKVTEDQGNLGVAWINDGGRISIVFNPFVVVPVGSDYVISLFPIEQKTEQDKGKLTTGPFARHNPDEDIPF